MHGGRRTSCLHVDPHVAPADTWALAFRVGDYLETGVARWLSEPDAR